MCDDFTIAGDDTNLARRGLSRREFAALSVSAALAGCTSGLRHGESTVVTDEQMVLVDTDDGVADAFFVHPKSGQHPGVILWPDIAGLRRSKKAMARALAAEGYAVPAVNHYYRGAKAPVLELSLIHI